MRDPTPRPQSQFLSGNEALAMGAMDAGVAIAAAYPGTPSTEILETLATFPGVQAEWSVNEKVALEVALGASMLGRRAITAMKHVGLNVAADTLMSAGLTGVGAGLVIAVADDVGFSSSQNEQDSRYWSRFAHLPVLEPCDAQEAYLMAREAFDLSERHQVPVLVRMTTRVCHVKRAVRLEAPLPPPARIPYVKDVERWIVTPNHVGKRLQARAERAAAMLAETEVSHWNAVEPGSDRRLGIVAFGPVRHAVREALPQAPLLSLGFSAPLPVERIRQFAATVDNLWVIEETEPLVETELRAAGLTVHGRSLLPPFAEVTAEHVARGARKLLGENDGAISAGAAHPVFTRPPTLCAGCGYLGVYYWLSRTPNAIVCGDIGCYTLGASPPWNSIDSILAMGASLGMAGGVARALEGDEKKKKPVIAVIGDSTFLHTGMPGLLNLTYHRANVTVLLLDNRATAMTGCQNNPANGRDLAGNASPVRVDFPKLVEALGVRPERIRSTDPYELPTFLKVLREEMKADEPSVIITTRPCVFTPEFNRERALVVDDDLCNGCATCLDVGCPAVLVTRREQQVRASGKTVDLAWVKIDEQLCTGCGICAKACSRGAIAQEAPKRIIALEPA